MPSSSGPSDRPRDPEAAAAVAEYLQRAEDDDVVCAFGPNYFRGACTGAFVGSILTSSLCWYSFRLLKADQREVDFLAGLRRGQRNPHFSSWTILRGLRTQPMLSVGCMALAATSVMKMAKCYLANLRCREFYQDDVEFALLQQSSQDDPKAAALLDTMEAAREIREVPLSPLAKKTAAVAQRSGVTSAAAGSSPSLQKPGTSMQSLLAAQNSNASAAALSRLIHRCPTFWDGVAVAFLGSVMDCYLPQKPVQRYYNMHVGLM